MRRPGSHVSGHVAHTVSVSQDEAREVYEAQRDEISSLSLPPARELRDYHKELWIRSKFCLKRFDFSQKISITGLAKRRQQQFAALTRFRKG